MRILFLSSIFPRSYDLTRGVYCRHLCAALSANHDVRVISPQGWLERLRFGRPQEIQTIRGPGGRLETLRVDYPCYYYPAKVLRSTYGWWMWQSIQKRVKQIVASFAPDCVLSYWAHPDGVMGVRAARLAGVPALVMVGGSDVLLLTHQPSRRRCVEEVLRSADGVVCVSADLKEKVEQLGVPAEQVHVVKQGIDSDLFHPGGQPAARAALGIPADRRVLLWVGRMAPVKGLDILLRACSLLQHRECPFHLYLVGDGPLRCRLEGESAKLGLRDKVSFVGSRLHHELGNWYRAADLTVLSSWSEGIPNVLRESLACGVPFVATRVGGVAEIAHDPRCVLVPPGDHAALASAIETALMTPAHTGRSVCQFGDWAQTAESILAIIRGLRTEPSHVSPRPHRHGANKVAEVVDVARPMGLQFKTVAERLP
jgi:glycosyltransferase involved in cell wall biosynthesis